MLACKLYFMLACRPASKQSCHQTGKLATLLANNKARHTASMMAICMASLLPCLHASLPASSPAFHLAGCFAAKLSDAVASGRRLSGLVIKLAN